MGDLTRLKDLELIPTRPDTLLDTMKNTSLPLDYRTQCLFFSAERAQHGPGTAFTPSGYLQLVEAIRVSGDDNFITFTKLMGLANYLQECIEQGGRRDGFVDRQAEEEYPQVGAAPVRHYWNEMGEKFAGHDAEDIKISELF